jgi:hypothetical protein
MKRIFLSLLIVVNILFGFSISSIETTIVKFFKTIGISSFEKSLLKEAKFISVKGKLVAKRNQTFNPYEEINGMTNIERMRLGLAPIGKDGKPVELHHLKQKDDGIIIELTSTEHRENYKVLHRYEKESQINRQEFSKWKREYWKQRARDFE